MATKTSVRYGIVFSGGGALGAWEAGAYRSITSRMGGRPAVVSGSSAGALNAAAIAHGMTQVNLEKLWTEVRPRDVFRYSSKSGLLLRLLWASVAGGMSVSKGLMAVASSLDSFADTSPLRNLLTQQIGSLFAGFGELESLIICSTNLQNEAPHYWYRGTNLGPGEYENIPNVQRLIDSLMASTAVPIIFPPVQFHVDGGILRNQPIWPVKAALGESTPGPIFVIRPQLSMNPADSPSVADVLPSIGSMFMNQGMFGELNKIRIYNSTKESVREMFPVCVIEPSQKPTHGLLDFGVKVLDLINSGAARAAEVVQAFEPNNPSTWHGGSIPFSP